MFITGMIDKKANHENVISHANLMIEKELGSREYIFLYIRQNVWTYPINDHIIRDIAYCQVVARHSEIPLMRFCFD